MYRAVILVLLVLATACSSSNPYLEQSLKPAAQRHENKEWFEKEWGKPAGTSKRFWGGERWTYLSDRRGNQPVLRRDQPP